MPLMPCHADAETLIRVTDTSRFEKEKKKEGRGGESESVYVCEAEGE